MCTCVFAQKISEIFQKYCLNFSTESIQYFCNNVEIFTTNCKYIAGLYTSLISVIRFKLEVTISGTCLIII